MPGPLSNADNRREGFQNSSFARETDLSSAISSVVSGPSIALQLHGEFQNFRSTLLNDMKSLLQAALQEVLDKHQVLVTSQEDMLRELLEKGEMAQPRSKSIASPAKQVSPLATDKTLSIEASVEMQDTRPHLSGSSRGTAAKTVHTVHGANKSIRMFGELNPWLKDETDIAEDPYDVTTLYFETGSMQWIARSNVFNNLTLLVICANAVYMGIDANENTDDYLEADWGFIVAGNMFCAFFFVEILVRFCAFRYKLDALKDAWFCFDSLLVVLMVIESWLLPILVRFGSVKSGHLRAEPLKLVRLLRLARITRLLRVFPELVTMVKGLLEATRAVTSAIVMLGFSIYAFGILLHSFLRSVPSMNMYFGTLPDTMWTLLVNGVFLDDVSSIVRSLVELQETAGLIGFLAFVLLSACTVMNMLIGVLCEVVNEVKAVERENSERDQVRKTLLVMLRDLDADGSGLLSKDEMLAVVEDPAALAILKGLKVDMKYFLQLQDMLFEESSDATQSISQIMSTILDCRGERTTTMQDLASSHLFSCYNITKLIERQEYSLKMYMQEVLLKIFEQKKNTQVAADPNRVVDQLQYWLYTNGLVETDPAPIPLKLSPLNLSSSP